jgi:hypothetical protein
MRIGTSIVAALLLSTPIAAQAQQAQIAPPTLFTIRSGETLFLHFATSVTNDCTPLWDHFDSIDVLDGPPEVTLEFKAGKGETHLSASGKVCPRELPGGNIYITLKGITEPKEANLTFRLNFHLKTGKPWQILYRYHLFMYPTNKAEGAPNKTGMAKEEAAALVWFAVWCPKPSAHCRMTAKPFNHEVACLEFAQKIEDATGITPNCFFNAKGIANRDR